MRRAVRPSLSVRPSLRSRPTRLALTVAAAAAALVAGPASLASAHSSAGPLRYVAMGDSYSAASGNVPPDPTAAPECLRSTVNYPHLIAAAITPASFTDVTCGAAKTSDYFTSQHSDVPPQLDAVGASTQLVTMTIGGNDSGVFIDSIVDCGSAGLSTAGQGSPCKDKYGSSFATTERTTTYQALVKALTAVHAAAPAARVAIIGYPWIMPKTVGCFPQMPIATGDVPYVRNIQSVLNDAVRRAAAATNSIYVNMNGVSNGHDACQAEGVRWIEPVVGGTNPVIVHPNPAGEMALAAQAMKVLHLS